MKEGINDRRENGRQNVNGKSQTQLLMQAICLFDRLDGIESHRVGSGRIEIRFKIISGFIFMFDPFRFMF